MTKAMMLFPVHAAGAMRAGDVDFTVPGLGWFENQGFDRIVKIELTGADIRSILEHAVSDATGPGEGSEHCAAGNCLLQVSGLRVSYDLARERGDRTVSVNTDDGDLIDDKQYTVATTEFQAKGYSGFRWFREGERVSVHGRLRKHIEHVIVDVLTRNLDGELPATDGRLVY